MKRIDISSPAGNELAQIALFERLQSEFNLHPGTMVKAVRKLAKREEQKPSQMFEELSPYILHCFIMMTANALLLNCGEPAFTENEVPFEKEIKSIFDLDARKLLKGIERTGRKEGFDSYGVIMFLHAELATVVKWAIAETETRLTSMTIKPE